MMTAMVQGEFMQTKVDSARLLFVAAEIMHRII